LTSFRFGLQSHRNRAIHGADLRRQGTTVLLVEQNAHMALSVADRGCVLETGRLVMQDKPEVLWDNEDVRTAYLGSRRT
jgi:branched-chain amino acid transport system ATP-binding protein